MLQGSVFLAGGACCAFFWIQHTIYEMLRAMRQGIWHGGALRFLDTACDIQYADNFGKADNAAWQRLSRRRKAFTLRLAI